MTLPPPDASSLKHNRAMFDRSGGGTRYTDNFGLELLEWEYGYVKFRLPSSGSALDGEGGIASGALLSAVDHVGALAAWTIRELGNPRYFGSTVKTQLEFFTERVAEDVYVEGRALAADRELINAEVSITTEGGQLVARGTTIYRIIDRGDEAAGA